VADLLGSAVALRVGDGGREGAERGGARRPSDGPAGSGGGRGDGGSGSGRGTTGDYGVRSRGWRLHVLTAEFRHAWRGLLRQPGLVFVVTLTLGIGVGAAATVFGLANEVLLRPPPDVTNPGGAAFVSFDTPTRRQDGIAGPDVIALREFATTLSGFATWDGLNHVHASLPGVRPLKVHGASIHGDYFEVLGVRPLLGRLLPAAETGPGVDLFRVVISERLWDELFHRSPDVVGRTLLLNDSAFTVLGVVAGGFRGMIRGEWSTDFWTPRAVVGVPGFGGPPTEALWSTRSELNQAFVVRPRPGFSTATAERELNAILDRLAEADPGRAEFLRSLQANVHGGLHLPPPYRYYIAPLLGVLAVAGFLILILPCVNVANLLLVRALDARGQVAVRRALGASRGSVARQALIESFLLGLLGTAAGLLMAALLALAIRGESLMGLPGFDGFTVDTRVLVFAAAAVLLTAVLSGTLPALFTARTHPAGALRRAGRQSTERQGYLRSGLAALQLALSLTLLVAGLLAVRTVRNLYEVDPGFRVADVQVLTLDLVLVGRPEGSAFDALRRRLEEGLRSVPGVETVAFHGVFGPFDGNASDNILPAGREEPVRVTRHSVTPEWFEALDVVPLTGRVLRPGDALEQGVRPIVLTAPLARRLFGRVNAVGERVRTGWRLVQEAQVVGVVGELRLGRLTSPPEEAWFDAYPGDQTSPMTILVRTAGEAVPGERLRQAVEEAAPGVPSPTVESLEDRVAIQLAEQRILARLLSLLATLAVLLAGVGLYGVLAYNARGRRREFALRMALGADGRRIGALVLK